jgi:hypothetical protein
LEPAAREREYSWIANIAPLVQQAPMGRTKFDPFKISTMKPAADNAAAWENSHHHCAILADDSQFQCALVRL